MNRYKIIMSNGLDYVVRHPYAKNAMEFIDSMQPALFIGVDHEVNNGLHIISGVFRCSDIVAVLPLPNKE